MDELQWKSPLESGVSDQGSGDRVTSTSTYSGSFCRTTDQNYLLHPCCQGQINANSNSDALNTFPLFPPLSEQQGASSTPPTPSLPQGARQVLENCKQAAGGKETMLEAVASHRKQSLRALG